MEDVKRFVVGKKYTFKSKTGEFEVLFISYDDEVPIFESTKTHVPYMGTITTISRNGKTWQKARIQTFGYDYATCTLGEEPISSMFEPGKIYRFTNIAGDSVKPFYMRFIRHEGERSGTKYGVFEDDTKSITLKILLKKDELGNYYYVVRWYNFQASSLEPMAATHHRTA